MKRIFFSFSLFACLTAGASAPADIAGIARSLATLPDYHGHVTYSVLLPQAEDPVTYDLELRSTASPADTLSPADYLIEWVYKGEKGFSAYFGGNHYRYRNNRLQEYHYDWDSIPLLMGVQRQAQFTDVLPQFLGPELERMLGDTTFVYRFAPDSIYGGERAAVLKGKVMYHGYVSKEVVYVFDPATGLPRVIEMENNPGAISEQSVTIQYDNASSEPFTLNSEAQLVELYPEIFERFRESNFRVENLPGTPLPSFTAPSSSGDRFTYHRGDKLENPALIVLLDDAVQTAPATVEAVRQAADRSPVNVDVIFAFTTNRADRAEEITGSLRPGEQLLVSARGMARDCGVTVTPTLIYVNRDGSVADVTLGYNKELSTVVIQKTTLMK